MLLCCVMAGRLPSLKMCSIFLKIRRGLPDFSEPPAWSVWPLSGRLRRRRAHLKSCSYSFCLFESLQFPFRGGEGTDFCFHVVADKNAGVFSGSERLLPIN